METIYKYILEEKQILMIIDIDNNSWYQGIGICEIFEIGNIHKTLKTLEESIERKNYSDIKDDKQIHGQTIFVSEIGLFNLLLKSKESHAEIFQKWLKNEVILSIRTINQYQLPKNNITGINNIFTTYLDKKKSKGKLKHLIQENKLQKSGTIFVKLFDNIPTYKISSTTNTSKDNYIFSININNYKICEKIIKDKLHSFKLNPDSDLYQCDLNIIINFFNKTKELMDISPNNPNQANEIIQSNQTNISDIIKVEPLISSKTKKKYISTKTSEKLINNIPLQHTVKKTNQINIPKNDLVSDNYSDTLFNINTTDSISMQSSNFDFDNQDDEKLISSICAENFELSNKNNSSNKNNLSNIHNYQHFIQQTIKNSDNNKILDKVQNQVQIQVPGQDPIQVPVDGDIYKILNKKLKEIMDI